MHTLISRYPRLAGLILLSGIVCGVLLAMVVLGKACLWLNLTVKPSGNQGVYYAAVLGMEMVMNAFCAGVLLLVVLIFFNSSKFSTVTIVVTLMASVIGYTSDSWMQVWESLEGIYHAGSYIVRALAFAVTVVFGVFDLPCLVKPACENLGRWMERRLRPSGPGAD